MLRHLFQRFKEIGGIHGFCVLLTYRFGNIVYYKVKIPIIRHILWILYRLIDQIIIRIFFNCEFPAQCKIGKGIILPHGGRGIVIHQSCKLGNNVVLYHEVTLGVRSGMVQAPIILDGAYIGAGAKILGTVTVGKQSQIGANSVVIVDIPDYATAVGVPTRIVKIRKSNIR